LGINRKNLKQEFIILPHVGGINHIDSVFKVKNK
jgi:hypothetical protein